MKRDLGYYVFLTLGALLGNLIGMWIFDSIKPQIVKEKVTTIQVDTCKSDTIVVYEK